MSKPAEMNPWTARALRALARPWTLGLVVVLLVNDHVLRRHVPSWVTGKLGDVAWLAFAPLVVAVPLSLLVARRGRARANGGDGVILTAMALVGGLFAAVKAFPGAHAGFVAGFRAVFGWTPLLVQDPTDLLTLPALGIAWLLYRAPRPGPRRAPVSAPRRVPVPVPVARHVSLSRRGALVLALASLATLANAGPPDEGILCVVVDEGRLLAGPQAGYGLTPTYAGTDGGLTWEALPVRPGSDEPRLCDWRTEPWTVTMPGGETIYRFTKGASIEQSTDGGATWSVAYELAGDEARVAYYQATRVGVSGRPGPHEAVVDPATGNLVVAMGQEGVLVRRVADGAWQWVAVGDYRFEPITGLGQVAAFIWGELWLAGVAFLVAFALGAWDRLRRLGRAAAVVVGLGVVLALLALRPAMITGYGEVIVTFSLLGMTVVALPLAIVAGVRLARGGGLPRALLLGLAAGVAGALPYVLWAFGVVPTNATAGWIAVVLLTPAFVAAGALQPRRGEA